MFAVGLVIEQIHSKEKPHAYLDHRNSARTMVARLLRSEYLFEHPAHWQYCPHSTCDCRHSHCFEAVRDPLDLQLIPHQGAVR